MIIYYDIKYLNLKFKFKMLDIYESCGYGAGFLFALSLIPQIYKSYRSKNMNDISFGWQFIFIIALIMSLVYSFHEDLPPIYISSLIELVFMIILLIMKVIYRDYNVLKENDSDNP